MKYNFIFAFLLAAILAGGYFGADIFNALFRAADSSDTQRKISSADPVYLIQADEMIYSPENILVSPDQYNYTANYHTSRIICSAMIMALSRYSTRTEMNEKNAQELSNHIRLSRNNYLHVEKFSYKNKYGKEMFSDFIVSKTDMKIIYLRFYPKDSPEPDRDILEKTISKIDNRFKSTNYATLAAQLNGTALAVMYEYKRANDDVLFIPGNDEGDENEKFYNTFKKLAEQIKVTFNSSSEMKFWAISEIMHHIEVITLNSYVTPVAGSYILPVIEHSGHNPTPSYSSNSGTVYQRIRIGMNQMVCYYDAITGDFQGFYAFPHDTGGAN